MQTLTPSVVKPLRIGTFQPILMASLIMALIGSFMVTEPKAQGQEYAAYGTYCPQYNDILSYCQTQWGCVVRDQACVWDYNASRMCSRSDGQCEPYFPYKCRWDTILSQCVGEATVRHCKDLDYTSSYECHQYGYDLGCEWEWDTKLCRDYSQPLTECPEGYILKGRDLCVRRTGCAKGYWNGQRCVAYHHPDEDDRRTPSQKFCTGIDNVHACQETRGCRYSISLSFCTASDSRYACVRGYELSQYGDCRKPEEICKYYKDSFNCGAEGRGEFCVWKRYTVAPRNDLGNGRPHYQCEVRKDYRGGPTYPPPPLGGVRAVPRP